MSEAEVAAPIRAALSGDAQRLLGAERTVVRYAQWSLLAGLVPFSVLDIAAVTGVQAKMIYDLSGQYGIPFQKERIKTLIGSLVGGVTTTSLASGVVGSAVRAIPLVGSLLGVVTQPAIAYATTVALGRVFISHFEAGGTLLDFDPIEMRSFYTGEVEKAAKEAEQAAAEVKPA
ncbi:YcjF family protein [Janthinobacterium agaricidamnosum]|uniref:GTPase domain-containing protein n=2 Tax=Janthinobacterium agaricidamnosum TaxID=55508 RepID=W0V0L0_9BURK|nr:DUF697 domain-containing protein [Janthinobacterium agaricidamnosum]CCM43857.1 GTPase domain-containing protein [Janthinobacterium agaricidamnosum]CDG80822.1 GTPase domain-containing protein [Janthinobacterium agaricidamnosum NBRC 102515 = DSM 9628]